MNTCTITNAQSWAHEHSNKPISPVKQKYRISVYKSWRVNNNHGQSLCITWDSMIEPDECCRGGSPAWEGIRPPSCAQMNQNPKTRRYMYDTSNPRINLSPSMPRSDPHRPFKREPGAKTLGGSTEDHMASHGLCHLAKRLVRWVKSPSPPGRS